MNPRRSVPLEEAPLLYTVEDAAAKLSIGRGTAYALIKSGDLRSVRIGSLRRVPADALREYVESLGRAS
jgi:excisionase family DNA binding protein